MFKNLDINRLNILFENDMLSYEELLEFHKMKVEEAVKQHPYKITYDKKSGRYYSYLPDNEKRRKRIAASSEEGIKQKIYEYFNTVQNQYTIADLWNDSIKFALTIGTKPTTIETNKVVYNKYIKRFGNVPLSKVNNKTFKEWHDIWFEQYGQISKSQFDKIRDCIACMFKYAEYKDLIDWDFRNAIKKVRAHLDVYVKTAAKKSVDKLVFSNSEEKAIYEYCMAHTEDIRNLLVLLLAGTGMRPGEGCALNVDSIDINRGIITVRRSVTLCDGVYNIQDSAKTTESNRAVCVPEPFMCALEQLYSRADNNGYISHYEDGTGRMIFPRQIRDYMKTLCRKLNIPYRSTDKFRKTFLTDMYDAGMSESDIKAQSGHTRIDTTLRHYINSKAPATDRKARMDNALANVRMCAQKKGLY